MYLKVDGSIWVMGGSGSFGEITGASSQSPVQVESSGVTSVEVGGEHSLQLRSDGSLWAVGSNYYGQLGDGTTVSRSLPVEVESSGGNFGECRWVSQFIY